jgi:hypothetical protein
MTINTEYWKNKHKLFKMDYWLRKTKSSINCFWMIIKITVKTENLKWVNSNICFNFIIFYLYLNLG